MFLKILVIVTAVLIFIGIIIIVINTSVARAKERIEKRLDNLFDQFRDKENF